MDRLEFDKSKNAYVFRNPQDIRHMICDLTLEEYTPPYNQVYIDYKGVRIAAKNNNINPSSLISLSNNFPEERWVKPATVVIPQALTREEIYTSPTNSSKLAKIYTTICTTDRGIHSVIPASPKLLAYWLPLFAVYKELFLQVYDEYVCDADSNVKLVELSEIEEVDLIFDQSITYTEQDIKATCHIILVSMNKSFPEEVRDQQLSQYIKNRKSAVYSTLQTSLGELKVQDKFFIELSTVFRSLPKLRSALFFMLKYKSKNT